LSTALLIIYIILFFWILKKWRFFRNSGISTNGLWIIFSIKLCAGLFLTWVYSSYYTNRLEADIFKYFDDSEIMYNALYNKPGDFFRMLFSIDNESEYFFNTYYVEMNNWDTVYDTNVYNDSHTIIRGNALIRIFSMGNFYIHTFAFTTLSMIGLTAIYKSFIDFFQNKKGALAIVIFLIPSVLFWSSGALKESILLFGMGIIILSLKNLTTNKLSIKYGLYFIISFALLFYIKFYVLLALIPSIIGYAIIKKFNLKYPFAVYSSVVLVCCLLAFNSEKIPPHFDIVETMVRKQKDFIRLAEVTEPGSRFELTTVEPSFIGIIKVVPEAITNCFIRPLPKKGISTIYLPAIFENIALLFLILLSIVSAIKKKTTLTIESKNMLWFSLVFVILLFAIIGLTTPVSGALVRYKVPALPFLGIIILTFLNTDYLTNKFTYLKFLK